jgi:hypothetical protein
MKPRVMKVGGRWYATDGREIVAYSSLPGAYQQAYAMRSRQLRNAEINRRIEGAEMDRRIRKIENSLVTGGSGE